MENQIEEMICLMDKLIENDLISLSVLENCRKEQAQTGDFLENILLRKGGVADEMEILPFLSRKINVQLVVLRDLNIAGEVIEKVPAKFATFFKVMPISYDQQTLTIAATDPFNTEMLDALAMIFTGRIKTVLSGPKDILESIRKYYGVGAETINQMMGTAKVQESSMAEVDDLAELDDEASIGKFINQILLEAYKDRATDIHIEPEEGQLQVRYRVDGILYDARVPANIWHFRDSISSRIKIMSNLNISERRLPQDGRFKVKVSDLELDLRVSFLPTQFGESIVIRILSSAKLHSLDALGLARENLNILDGLLKLSHGIIFVTGPTGSGKTTTLYSALALLNKAERKIITIEDPIEYQLKGVTQIQIHPDIGLTFSSGLRSMLRHDPDVMMVGEVRDLETAQIAIQIALTGHLVFSTLHTNDSASGITRLIDMGVEPYLISSSVECFVAQRLVRLLCPKCKQPAVINKQIAQDLGVSFEEIKNENFFESKGCSMCNFTGFIGRKGIYEFLRIDDNIRELIMNRGTAAKIKQAAVKSGMRTMTEDGWLKVKAGITSAQEVLRVIRQQG